MTKLTIYPQYGRISRHALERISQCMPRDLVDQKTGLVELGAERASCGDMQPAPRADFATPAIVESPEKEHE